MLVGLQGELDAHQKHLSLLQGLQIGAILLILLVAVSALGFDLVHGEKLRISLLGAAGLSVPAMLTMLRQTVKDWSKASLFLTLVKYSDEEEARDLLKKYAQSKT